MSEPTKQIFILSGQSNMSGRGGIITNHHTRHKHWDGVVPQQSQPHPTIQRLTSKLTWVPACEPLHIDIDSKKVCGLGPGMAFANMVRENLGGEIRLVPCAVGGTKIKEWARGEELYENMVKRVKESAKDGGVVKGLLWYQGESDTYEESEARVYGEKMKTLVENVREDLGLPQLPIIQVALASGDHKYLEKVREAQLSMKIPNVVCVDAKGLHLQQDHLHLTTEAQVKLGQMLAEAYLNHFASSKPENSGSFIL